jgi:metal-responsive CopG/Arc/MetJ family transcriptional regulator
MNDFVEVELELEEELIEYIDKTAEEEGLTRDEFINKAIAVLVENYEKDLKDIQP